ncbi:acyl-CoA thioesterase [Maribellus sediminis]|uniref:acyl-CoA thioesterase n=1 Tax=Maribellus sediminis TaxID=2696285 RepID=UPI001431516B|nr:acyl-CoA thioesterase [Maribellus sediminis]
MKKKSAEIIVSHRQVFPNDANPSGNMFGGRIMEIMDVTASITASRYASNAHHCVTASVETVQFNLPVHIGDILKFVSQVVHTGHSSMVIRVIVQRYNRNTQLDEICTSAHLIFVAMNADDKPIAVPELDVSSPAAKRAWEIGSKVREKSLKIKSMNES